jgi:hypothetical protein
VEITLADPSSGSRGANPLAAIAYSGDRHRTQQEIPVAKVHTTHTLQLTTEELNVLYSALKHYTSFMNEDEEVGSMYALENTLKAPLESAIECEKLRRQYRAARLEVMKLNQQAEKFISAS